MRLLIGPQDHLAGTITTFVRVKTGALAVSFRLRLSNRNLLRSGRKHSEGSAPLECLVVHCSAAVNDPADVADEPRHRVAVVDSL